MSGINPVFQSLLTTGAMTAPEDDEELPEETLDEADDELLDEELLEKKLDEEDILLTSFLVGYGRTIAV